VTKLARGLLPHASSAANGLGKASALIAGDALTVHPTALLRPLLLPHPIRESGFHHLLIAPTKVVIAQPIREIRHDRLLSKTTVDSWLWIVKREGRDKWQ
jgi:hypothetical protein